MRILIAGLILASASAAAIAAPAPPAAPPPPVRLFVSPMGEPFRAKGDGDDPVSEWFGQADKDRDGALTAAEMQADAARFFDTIDINHNGELDPDEIARYEREIAPEIQLGQQLGGMRWGGRRADKAERKARERERDGLQGAGRYAWLNIPEPVAAADADLNRGVSRAEFVAAAGERFLMLDPDHDGAIRRAELPLLPSQRSEEERKQARKKPKRAEGIPIPLDP
jgi:Ca2+-binding EF-hand superfamily protein